MNFKNLNFQHNSNMYVNMIFEIKFHKEFRRQRYKLIKIAKKQPLRLTVGSLLNTYIIVLKKL